MLCCGVLTGCLSSRPTSQGVVRIETGCPRVPASRHCDHERRLPPPPTALPLFHGSCSAGVGPGLVDAPPHILCVAPVCVRVVWCVVCVWMGIARVCSSRPVPTCEGPVCRAPAPASAQDLQLPFLGRRLSMLTFLSLVADAARCMFSPPSLAPLAPPPRPSGGCVFGPVCDMRMWCDDVQDGMLPHGSWWREGRGGLRCPTCESFDGARYPTLHRR